MRTTILKNECLIGDKYGKRLVQLFDEAEKTIEIVMFEWRWYRSDPGNPMQMVNAALVRAARRGVIVRVVTSNKDVVEILKGCKILARKGTQRGYLHSKLVIIDNEVLVMGSHNFTGSALNKNIETSMLIPCLASVQNFKDFFNRLWQSSIT